MIAHWQDVPCKLTSWPCKHKGGYGTRGHRYAHREALEQKLGRPIKPGYGALHHCDNPPCIEPVHLFEGTNADNVHDMIAKGRSRVRVRPPCGTRAGHEFHYRRGEECTPCSDANKAYLVEYHENRKPVAV